MNFNILNKGRSLLSDDQNKKFNFFIIMFLIAMVLETAGIGMVIPILNLFSQNNFHEKVDEFLKFVDLEKYSNEDLIIFSIIILLVLYTIKALFLTFVSYQQSKFLSEIKSSTSERIFKIYLKKPFTFHLENNSAKLIRNLNDINLFTVFIRTTLLLFIEVIMFFGVGLLIFFYEPLGTIFSMTILGLLGFFFHRKIQKKAGQWGEQRRTFDGNRMLSLQHSFGSIKDIKILGREETFINKFSFLNKSSAIAEYNNAFVISLPRIYFEWLTILGIVTLFFLLLGLNKEFFSFIPIMGLFTAAAIRLVPSVVRIMNSLQMIRYTAPVINNLVEMANTEGSEKKFFLNKNKYEIVLEKNIEVKNLCYSYPSNKRNILSNVNFVIDHGTSIGIVGQSGVGKTTLLNLLLGLLEPSEGTILVDGKKIDEGIRSWQSQIGYVPQNVYLIDDTLRANIAFGVPEKKIDNEKINHAIKKAKLETFFDDVNTRIDTGVGEFGDRLSGGQKQRIGIVRALYNDPKVIIMDEPTSSLDLNTEKAIIDEVNFLKREKTIIMISHRLSALSNCDKIYKLTKEGITNYEIQK